MRLGVWRGSSENSKNKIHVISKKKKILFIYIEFEPVMSALCVWVASEAGREHWIP